MKNESMFISGHLDGALRFWSGRTEKKVHEIPDLHHEAITSLSITNDGKYVLTNSRDHTLKLVDLNTFETVCTFENDAYLNSSNYNRACVSPNSKYGVAGSRNGSVVVF